MKNNNKCPSEKQNDISSQETQKYIPEVSVLDLFLTGVTRTTQIDKTISFEPQNSDSKITNKDVEKENNINSSLNVNNNENALNLKDLSNVMRPICNKSEDVIEQKIIDKSNSNACHANNENESGNGMPNSIEDLISKPTETEIQLINVLKSKPGRKSKYQKHTKFEKKECQSKTDEQPVSLAVSLNTSTQEPEALNNVRKKSSYYKNKSLFGTTSKYANEKNNSNEQKEKQQTKNLYQKNDLSQKTSEEINKKLFQKALWLCSKSEQLSNNLSQKLLQTLKNWNVSDEQNQQMVENILQKLKSLGYVDDLRFCKMFIKNKIKKKSLKSCIFELTSKGVSRDILSLAQEEFNSENNPISPKEQIYLIWKKKFDSKPTTDKDKNKQMRYFASRGFELSVLFDIWKNPQNFIDFD